MKLYYISLLVLLLAGCGPEVKDKFGNSISKNEENIKIGKAIFEQKCGHCHNFMQDAIGPNLNGITRSVETEWIKRFIENPFNMVAEDDARAKALHKEYKIYMPAFKGLSEDELDALLSYMHTYVKNESKEVISVDNFISDPIRDSLPYSELMADLEFVVQVPPSSDKSPMARINKLDCSAGSGRIFVNDLRGKLYEIKNDTLEVFLSVADRNENFIHEPGFGTGFGSFTFHPDFDINGLLYTAHSESSKARAAHFTLREGVSTSMQWVIQEWKTKDPRQDKFRGTVREILRIDFPGPIHGIQEIAFNPRASKVDPDYGMLYIGVGDGGSVVNGHPDIALHDGSGILGTILRIDPTKDNSENGNYGIPKDNPFINDSERKNEIWAYGFRNPNRMAWNLEGTLFVSDIGHKIVEEVNAVLPGEFYGWPIREGTFVIDPFGNQSLAFLLPENDEDFGITYPVIQYDHDEGAAISGGFFGEGGDFDGKYIFGDIPQGTVFMADSFLQNQTKLYKLNISLEGQQTDFSSLVQNNRVDLRFGQDCEGNIYMLTKADGKIYKMIQD